MVADLGYEWIELSPREDFTPFFLHPRANDDVVRRFKAALHAAGVGIASHLPLYRWSGPDEYERQAAVRYWKRAIQLTAALGATVMNSEFNGRPEQASRSEAQFWKSMEELLPVLEGEASSCGWNRTRTTSSRTAGWPSTWCAGSTPRSCPSCTARRTRSTRAATSPGSWSTRAS